MLGLLHVFLGKPVLRNRNNDLSYFQELYKRVSASRLLMTLLTWMNEKFSSDKEYYSLAFWSHTTRYEWLMMMKVLV